MAEGVAPPGLFGNNWGQAGLDGIDGQQVARAVITRRMQRGNIDPAYLGQGAQLLGSRRVAAGLQGVDEGGQEQLPVPQEDHIQKGGQGFGIGGEHGAAPKDNRIAIAALAAPGGDSLCLQ